MMPNLIEIILIILIVVIVFGLGKLSDLGKALGEMRAKYLEGREDGEDQTIDITPQEESADATTASRTSKAGEPQSD